MKKCEVCGKETNEVTSVDIYLNEEKCSSMDLCPNCLKYAKEAADDKNFGKKLVQYSENLLKFWEKGTKEKTKVRSIVKIIKLHEESTGSHIGETGAVTLIDDAGQLHGTWGGLAIIPEIDEFLLLKSMED